MELQSWPCLFFHLQMLALLWCHSPSPGHLSTVGLVSGRNYILSPGAGWQLLPEPRTDGAVAGLSAPTARKAAFL